MMKYFRKTEYTVQGIFLPYVEHHDTMRHDMTERTPEILLYYKKLLHNALII